MYYLPEAYLSIPDKPGVYEFLGRKGTILYVGKANNLKSRVASYFTNKATLEAKTAALVSQIEKIKVTIVESELESLLLEVFYIKKYSPKYNIRMTDGKAYPLIRISVKHEFPAVLYARLPEDRKSIYYGPFPSAKDVKLVIKTLRKIFPFHTILNHSKQVCLYNHLGLCPCLPASPSAEKRKLYKTDMRRIVAFLEGKTRVTIRELEKQRDQSTKAENFEQASKLQRQINALTYITQPYHTAFEYAVNPNLREDLRQKELDSLRQMLNEKIGYHIPFLQRIECFDISNIQGTNAVGSMVVFMEGEKDGDKYRRFKIKKTSGPNDFAMMEEVLSRRLKHTEWQYPNLLIVDGGKGQVTSAMKVLVEKGITLPVIGLAKRLETIVTMSMEEISLSKNSPALKLIMRIRDEAHRFAVSYHRKLRSKASFKDL